MSTHASVSTFEFRRLGEQEVLSQIRFEELQSIEVIAHTGKVLVANLINALDVYAAAHGTETVQEVVIRILIRHPDYETSRRREAIEDTIRRTADARRTRGYKIDVHFYQPLPTLRAIICTPLQATVTPVPSLLSFYWFPEAIGYSRNCPNALVKRGRVSDHNSSDPPSLLQVYRTWFDNYWGRSKSAYRFTHTIVLDFDDTIANSHPIQIDAWVTTILEAQQRFNVDRSQFHHEVLLLLDSLVQAEGQARVVPPSLVKHVAKVFFEEQDAKKIIDRLFMNLSPSQRSQIEDFRIATRRQQFDQAKLFVGAHTAIQELSETHQLVVISATDEDYIEKYLANCGLRGCFKYVFGKNEHGFSWGSLSQKAQLLLKTLGILGVPATRVVFVGDNNRDFVAANQVGIDFIEARLFADEVEDHIARRSLISPGTSSFYFQRWSKFDATLREVELRKSERYPTNVVERNLLADSSETNRRAPVSSTIAAPSGIKANIDCLIDNARTELIGREDELELLNDAWAKAIRGVKTRPRILTFVSLGGGGKTSLVAKWAVTEMLRKGWPGCESAFAWSFYSQGTREKTAASSDNFLKAALLHFGDEAMANSAEHASVKGKRIAELAAGQRSLLILDGLEPLQCPPLSTAYAAGTLNDEGIAALLRGLAADSRGLCLVTTRVSLPDLDAFKGNSVEQIELKSLSREAGMRLLHSLGVKGTMQELVKLVEEARGHALTLNLLGSYLVRAKEGDVRRVVAVQLDQDFEEFTPKLQSRLCEAVEDAAGLPKGSVHVVATREGSVVLLLKFRTEQERAQFLLAGLNGDPLISELRTKWRMEFLTASTVQSEEVPSPPGTTRDQVFVSYSHVDKDWLDKLLKTLKPLVRKQAIDVWADTRIKAGKKWKAEIEQALAQAKVAVLLVSQDFLASDFIANEEIPPILAAAESQGLRVIWIPLTDSLYDATTIGDYQAAHDPAQPLDGLVPSDLNKALVTIAKSIRDAAST